MIRKKDYKKIEKALADFLSGRFRDLAVQIGEGIHYRGVNVVLTSPDFDGLLPEQRFHHVVQCIPPEFYENNLRSGLVWFELTPDERGTDLMKMPRSEDVAEKEAEIDRRLDAWRFYDRFERAVASGADGPSRHDFVTARRILEEAGASRPEELEARLLFIRRGAASDADLVTVVMPEQSAPAAGT